MNAKTHRTDHIGFWASKHVVYDSDGSVTFDESSRYSLATSGELIEWMFDGSDAVRNAAVMELDERGLGEWASRH